MKAFINVISIALFVVFAIGANIGAIGYGLYLWGGNTPLNIAAWTAFVLWLKLISTAAVAFIVALATRD